MIEVKRGTTLDTLAREDLAYLKQLRKDTAGRFRTFLVLVTEGGRPKDGLTERGTADRQFAIEGFPGVRVRRVLRAIGHAAEYEDGLRRTSNRTSSRSIGRCCTRLSEAAQSDTRRTLAIAGGY